QWSLFQAKRLRGSSQRGTLDIIETTSDVRPLDAAALKKAEPGLESPVGQQMLVILEGGPLPTLPPGPALDGNVKAALEALESAKSEPEVVARLAHVTDEALDAALGATRDRAPALGVALGPIKRSLEELETGLVRRATVEGSRTGPAASLRRDVTVARLRYTARRYDTEARLNQAIASVYELQVRRSNIEAE